MHAALASLSECVIDAGEAITSPFDWPARPTDGRSAAMRVEQAAGRLPPLYRALVVEPLRAHLWGYHAQAGHGAALLEAVTGAVLQRAEGFLPAQTWALQEVVSDLYDGFLSAEDRQWMKLPDSDVPAPLVRWASRRVGARSIPAEMLRPLGVLAGVVSFPVGCAEAGLLTSQVVTFDADVTNTGYANNAYKLELGGSWAGGRR